jgi:hypothetical protein
MHVDGNCHCGQITFRAEVDPEQIEICHCTDCQALSGSVYRTIAPAQEVSFELLSGELKRYAKTAEDGSIRVQSFAPSVVLQSIPSRQKAFRAFWGLGLVQKNKEINLCQKCSTGLVQLNNGLKTFRTYRRQKQNNRMCETQYNRIFKTVYPRKYSLAGSNRGSLYSFEAIISPRISISTALPLLASAAGKNPNAMLF